ncbi:hypothetical protein C8R45DRAFT_1139337 [Mycena sanguinolenta]|nr:hypothetical protein C8R45DRAFT_1139337 [Mycena sanguinolenta]
MSNGDLRARLTEVNASIDQLKSRLAALEDVRSSIQRQLDSVVYPVLTLPNEITSHIFLKCLPPAPDFDRKSKGGPTSLEAPLLLLQICGAWRRVALSTPGLWVYLHLNLERLPIEMEDPELQQLISDWFDRAGSCRLSISMQGYIGMEGFGCEAISAVIQLYAPRLQDISLRLERRHLRHLAGIGPFPVLQRLLIALPFLDDEEDELSYLEIFSTAPQLHQLFYTEGTVPSMFSLPYGALSTLTCEKLRSEEFLDLLRSADLLKEFKCSVTLDDNDHLTFPTTPVTHKHLRTLRLINYSSTHFIHLLRLPSLQDLTLQITNRAGNFPSFLAHSPSLQRFVTGAEIPALSVDWFSAMPGLTDIMVSIPSPSFLLDFFSRLNRTYYQGFLPHLRSLAFIQCPHTCTLDKCVPALASRCSANENRARLESFRHVWRDGDTEIEEPMVAAFRALVEQGMEIHVGPSWRNDISDVASATSVIEQ